MRKLLAGVAAVFLGIGAGQVLRGQQATRMRTSIVDVHEGITIGVDPWTSSGRYKDKFSKKSPYNAGIVALQLMIRNDNEEPVRLNRERIRLLVQLDEDHKQELQPLSSDDVADSVMLKQSVKDPTLRRNPLPIPIGGGGAKPTRDKNWTDFRDTCQNAALPSPVIAPHSTMEGLVYFDLRGEVDLLQNARLYIPDMQRMTTNQAILYFDIEMNRRD
jgi:hypothetical protein